MYTIGQQMLVFHRFMRRIDSREAWLCVMALKLLFSVGARVDFGGGIGAVVVLGYVSRDECVRVLRHCGPNVIVEPEHSRRVRKVPHRVVRLRYQVDALLCPGYHFRPEDLLGLLRDGLAEGVHVRLPGE